MPARVAAFFQPSHPLKAGNISPERRRKLLWSYAPDWIITLLLAALFLSLDKIDGYRRVFSLEDTSLRHPYTLHERVPNLWLYVLCGVVPLVFLPIINFFTVRSWWDLHNSWLGLTLGLSLTGSITQFVKITVGRPRPDVVARCIPPPGATDPPFGLTSWEICTQTSNKILRDGFRSFPSGHSSMSFAGLGFLAYYLAGKLHLFDRRGHAGKAWISLAPFSVAALIAISRSMDYRHHWHDILVGSLLGTVVSYFAYRQYYPELHNEFSHRPYSPRIKDEELEALATNGSSPVLPLHHNGEHTVAASAYSKSGHLAPSLSNRYNPSPPPPHHQRPSAENPFVQSHSRIGSGNSGTANAELMNTGYELDKTVPRPGQGSLTNTWQQGGGGVDGTVPRAGYQETDLTEDEPYGGYKRETRIPGAQGGSGLT